MSHYSVNASVPKTLIQFLLRWAIDTHQFGEEASEVLGSVLETDDLARADSGRGRRRRRRRPQQDTESIVGPYELQDFFLYYILRFGYRPSKVAFLAEYAWGDRDRGDWPDLIPLAAAQPVRAERDPALARGLSASVLRDQPVQALGLPNAPKVGSGGSLSPRSDWRAPSDGRATPGWRSSTPGCRSTAEGGPPE